MTCSAWFGCLTPWHESGFSVSESGFLVSELGFSVSELGRDPEPSTFEAASECRRASGMESACRAW